MTRWTSVKNSKYLKKLKRNNNITNIKLSQLLVFVRSLLLIFPKNKVLFESVSAFNGNESESDSDLC
jgi:hypothetical protein